MDNPSFASVPDWSRDYIGGVQGVVRPETGFKSKPGTKRLKLISNKLLSHVASFIFQLHRYIKDKLASIPLPKTTIYYLNGGGEWALSITAGGGLRTSTPPTLILLLILLLRASV
jgi:hypothetical protein